MRGYGPIGMSLVAGAAVMMLGGCGASYQARDMEIKQTMLVNPALLVKGTDGQSLYLYENPDADIKKYTKILLEPVLVSKPAELDADDLENYQKLADNAYAYLNAELKKDYPLVSRPGPEVMRVQMAIIDADTSKPVRNLLSSVNPVGMAVSAVRYGATGKQSGVGEISVEYQFTDASTGELLGAAVDRRVGGKAAQGIWDTWYNADEALQYWAQKVRYDLCAKRGGTNCQKP